MKKLMVVLMGLLFSASAFAQDAKGPEFKYSVWANAFAITETTAKKDEYKDYSNIRVRPMFTLTNENVSVVARFEIDQYFGELDSPSKENHTPLGADRVNLETKNIYIDVKDMFMPGLSLRAGVAGYKYPIAFDNDASLFNVKFDAGMAKIDLAYIKAVEGSTIENTSADVEDMDDEQIYAAKVALNLGDITVTPAILYAVGEEQATSGEYALMMPALSFAMKQGPLSVDADFVYVTGSYDTADVDVSAYAAYVNVGYKVSDALKVNVFGLYATGQDDSTDVTSFNDATWGDMEVGPMFIINDAGRINQVGISNEYDKASEGLMMFGLSAEFKMDKLTVLGQIAYATTTSDEVTKETAIGTELNLRLAYEVAPKTSVWGEFAYLAAGDYVEAKNSGDNDNPMYYALGVMTSF